MRKTKPSEASLRGRIGALVTHSRYDPSEITKAAREAAEAKLMLELESQVDPGRTLSAEERARRVEYARRAHFARLAYRSARVRRARRNRNH